MNDAKLINYIQYALGITMLTLTLIGIPFALIMMATGN